VKLLIVADGRSPITLNWIRYLVDKGHEVHLASTYPCMMNDLGVSLRIITVAFSQAIRYKDLGEGYLPQDNRRQFESNIIKKMTSPRIRTILRQWLGPLTIPRAARRLKHYIQQVQPDMVHAMRIPYEGMLAADATPAIPLLFSVWGNDFTLHARANPWMGYKTRKAIQRADAIHTDCWRDLRLAHEWGFSTHKPSVVLPSSGGVRMDVFYPAKVEQNAGNGKGSERICPTVINPRGFRAYVRNDVFFKAIPLVLKQIPKTRFVCPGMQGERQAHAWVAEMKIAHAVDLLPYQTPQQMAELFRTAKVTVSPTIHDGTPNSLLESMACGCFPIAGDLESLREWITSGVNGLLVNPTNIQDLADAIVRGIIQTELREQAAEYNLRLISERADYQRVMEDAGAFYEEVVRTQAGKSR
jgi:glycosyltransferase involved in cell wall biosynthesis